jgi:hypothetical protein
MDYEPRPAPAHATFTDGKTTVRLSFPAEEAPSWRTATAKAILGQLGFEVLTAPLAFQPNGTEAARLER